MTRPRFITGALALILAGALAMPHPAKGAAKSAMTAAAQCFHGSDISGWRAPDARTIYLRVFAGRYYRVELSRACSPLTWPGARLITHAHGGDLVCAPVDFDIRASEGPGDIPEPCFVKSITALSTDEAAALPRKAKP
jgi:hypothetical protein